MFAPAVLVENGPILVNNIVMSKANVFEVKAKLSEYLDRAASGERILICRHNKPVAELRAVSEGRTEPRPIGPLPGRPTFEVPPSFFEPMPEEDMDLWEGKTDPAPPPGPPTPARTTRRSRTPRRGARRRS